MEKKLDDNRTRMIRAVLNKSWKQHPTKQQLYGYLHSILKTIQVYIYIYIYVILRILVEVGFYPSVEMQSVYTIDPADRIYIYIYIYRERERGE